MNLWVCKRQLALAQRIMQKVQFNNRWIIDQSQIVKQIVGKHTDLIGHFGEQFDLIAREYLDFKAVLKKESNLDITLFNDDMSALFGQMARGIGVQEWRNIIGYKGADLINERALLKEYITKWSIKGNKDKVVFEKTNDEGMAYFGKFLFKDGTINEKRVDTLVDFIIDTFKPIETHGYNLDNVFKYLNEGDILQGVISSIRNSYKLDIASAVELVDKKAIKNFQEATDMVVGNVRAELAMKGIQPTVDQLDTFVKDFVGDALLKDSKMAWVWNFNNSLKGIYWTLKYFAAPFTAPLMMAQAFVIGSMNLDIRSRGLPMLYRGDAVNYFLDDLKILKGENPFDKTIYEELSDSWYGTFVNKILPHPKLQAMVKGGWQTMFEMVSDWTVKRLSVATALSKEGWNFKNESELLNMVKDGNISKEALNRINANALLFYTDFRTNSSSLFLSRNAFSRWHAFNALQWYVVNRSSEIFRGIYNFWQAIRQGKMNTFGDLFKYIEDPANAEFKWLCYAPLLATKYSFFADKMLNEGDTEENRVAKITEYSLGVNDFLSSFDATFIGRLLGNTMDYEGVYIDYVNSKGETWTISGGVEAWVYWILSAVMSSMFKEMKVLNIVANPAKMILNGETDIDSLMEQAGVEFRKIAEGMGRYNLLPGIETYWLKKVPESDDYFSSVIMSIGETNQSVKTSQKLRKVEEIEKILSNPFEMKNALMYLDLLKIGLDDTPSVTEMKFDRFRKATTTDPVMINLYNGVFDRDIFNEMTQADMYNMYSDLTNQDLSKMKIDKNSVTQILGASNLEDMKLWTFIGQLTNKLGMQRLNWLIDQWNPSATNVGIQQMFSMAEQKIPGSSRAIMAYAAGKMQDKYVIEANLAKWVPFKDAKNETTLTPSELAEIQKNIIQTVYPSLYITDKSSWYGLVAERAKQIDPRNLGKTSKEGILYADKSASSFINSLGLLDMIAYQEGQKGNPDAKYIASVYSLIGKYVKDPKARLHIMNNTYESIERLNIDPKMKATIKLGNALGNIDVLDKAVKDPEFMKKNAKVVDNAIRTVFGTLDQINNMGMSTFLEELGTALKGNSGATEGNLKGFSGSAIKQANSFGRSTDGSQYDNSNRKALEQLSNKIPSLIKRLPSTYKPWQNIRLPYDVNAKYETPKPIQYAEYQYITRNLNQGSGDASTAELVAKVKPEQKVVYKTSDYNTPKWKEVKQKPAKKHKFKVQKKSKLTFD